MSAAERHIVPMSEDDSSEGSEEEWVEESEEGGADRGVFISWLLGGPRRTSGPSDPLSRFPRLSEVR
jgi:hypothetical protein